MKRISCAIAVLSMFCFIATPSAAQSKTGTPAFGTFGGGPFDTINLANLNVHFAVPVVQKAGRGIPFDYLLSYDSSIWEPVIVGASTLWQPATNWGWRGQTEAAVGYVPLKITEGTCRDPETGATQPKTTYTYSGYYDEFGTYHGMPVHIIDNPCFGTVTNSGPATATDGSGYTLTADIDETATVKGRGGEVSSPPVSNIAGSGNVIDNNGNKLTTTGTSFTDTLGTTALSISGGAPNPLNFTYTGPSNTAVSVALNYTSFTVRTNFQCSGIGNYGPIAVSLVSSVRMPDGTSYTINYEPTPGFPGNVTGRIQSITLPSGGTISYAYSGPNNGINCADGSPAILTRTTPDGAWTYDHTIAGTAGTTTITDPKANRTVLNFQQIYETQRKIYQGTTTLLETVQTCYNGAAFPCDSTAITLPIARRTTLVQLPDTSGKVSKQDTFYNSLGLVTETHEYDFGSGAPPATPVRKGLISYATLGNGIADRPSSIQLRDGAGGIKAETTFGYDETAATTTAGTPQHVAITGARGNQTSATYKVQGTTTVGQTFTYFDTGMVKTATDLKGNVTSFTYGACGNSFVTSVGLPLALSGSAAWNCTGGVMTSSTDENNQAGTVSYGDPNYWRATQVNLPGGGQSSTAYNLITTPWNIVQTTKINATQNLTTKAIFDGLGRIQKQQLTSDPQGITSVDTVYDASGMLQSVSNPYRSQTEATYGVTSQAYDGLGRPTTTTTPTSNTVQTVYEAAVSGAGGRSSQLCPVAGVAVLSIDQMGRKRQAWSDALGRVIEVLEPEDNGSIGTLTGANPLATCYTYDMLDNLMQVEQRGGPSAGPNSRIRTFTYDSLSRMTSETTPEAGTVTYLYTNTAGALCSGNSSQPCRITGARGITTTLAYDALNRLTSRTHSDATPAVTYLYDQTSYNGLTITNGKGRRTGMSDGSGATAWSYDVAGRVVAERRTISGVTKTISYAYNPDGSLASITYPGGRTVTYTANAAGRVSSAVDAANNINFATDITYAPQGAFSSIVRDKRAPSFNGITTTYTYRNLLQLDVLKVTSSNGTKLHLDYSFNNGSGIYDGNLYEINNLLSSGRETDFNYDHLRRLKTAQSAATAGTECWGQSYTYDGWGNLTNINQTKCSSLSFNQAVNTNNRFSDPSFQYDAAGNLKQVASTVYTWNGANQLASAGGVTYSYDGDGLRVKRSNGKLYWRGLDGKVLAETDLAGATDKEYVYVNGELIGYLNSTGVRYYYYGDHLGSARLLTNADGLTREESDFLPYGEERVFTDMLVNRHKYTGYERDTESNLDYAFFRQYSLQYGRFMSPDPLHGNVLNPQSWNRYAYVLNNPTNLVDPLGLCEITVTSQDANGNFHVDCADPAEPGDRTPNDATQNDPGRNGPGASGGCSVRMGGYTIRLAACPGGGGRGGRRREHEPTGNSPDADPAGSLLSDLREYIFNRPWVLSWIVPLTPEPGVAGVGPAGSWAWNPVTHTLCGSLGAGASVGKNVSLGPLTFGRNWRGQPASASDFDKILSGWSINGGVNLPMPTGPGPGGQVTASASGWAIGPTVGVPGGAVSVTYAYCAKLW